MEHEQENGLETADLVEPTPIGALARGVEVIREALRSLPPSPGVYRMLNAKGDALYVGKARNLKSRVANYTHAAGLSTRLKRMVAETHALEVVHTHTEVEALLLECNLIKRLLPRYNVLLRDDKSFPYIHLTGDHDFPQLAKHRGARGEAGDYFGPFANAGAVNRTLIALQRAFLLRSCSDSIFQSRTRPCLLYQIKRCSGPCVGRLDKEGYGRLVNEARAFLAGRSREVQEQLARRMQELSEGLAFESAALLRDRIRALTQVQGRQDINVENLGDADIIAAHQAGGHTSIQVFFFRGGQNWGNRAYFPSHDRQLGIEDVLAAFIGQFYDNKPVPPCVLASHVPSDRDLLAEALSTRAGHRIDLATPQRGDKRKLVEHALVNAREALARKLAESSTQQKLLAGLAEAFGLDAPPQRIEVYDNSHIQGTHPVGAMIVAGPDGFQKNAYRKFNIRGDDAAPPPSFQTLSPPGRGQGEGAGSHTIAVERPPHPSSQTLSPPGRGQGEGAGSHAIAVERPPHPDPLPGGEREKEREASGEDSRELDGSLEAAIDAATGMAAEGPAGGDDYAMMREVLRRRFARALREDPERDRGTWPDLILIDGGAGQLSSVQRVMTDLGIADVPVVGIAKGPDRDAGRERFFRPGRPPMTLEPRDPVLYFLQRLRDEAHRFAIGTHRARRTKAIGSSPLDEIAGIGARRKRALLVHFGSARGVARAGLADLERVEGISRTVAKKVYDHFHAEG